VTGFFTTKLTLNVYAGYSNGFYQYTVTAQNPSGTGPNPNTGVGGLQLTWKPTQLSSGGLGYKHSFENSLLGAYYDSDSVYVRWGQNIWRFKVSLGLTYTNLRFQGINAVQGIVDDQGNPVNDRSDHNVSFGV